MSGPVAIATRLRDARRRGFVGRIAERELLAAAIAGEPGAFTVLFLHGPGGIGKTALLSTMAADAAAAGLTTVAVDGRVVGGSATTFTAAAGRALGLPPDADPLRALSGGPRTLVLVDTFERCTGLTGWLREAFLPRLPDGSLAVIAGREPPDETWRLDPGWHELTRTVALRNLAPDHARDLLAARGVPDRLAAPVLAFAGGHPLALCLAAEVIAQGAGESLPDGPDVVGALLARFVDEAPSARHRAALEVCAHSRVTTASLLRAALDDPDADELFAWLRARSFVESGPEGLHPHDLAREVLDADLRWRDPDRYRDVHHRVRTHLISRLPEAPSGAPPGRWLDVMFLHRRNPLFGPFLSWRPGAGEYEDALRPADHEILLSMTGDIEGAASATIVGFWLSRRPQAFRVYRRPGRAVPLGFSLWLRLDGPAAEELTADPVVAAAWAYAQRQGPPRPGEHLGMLRSVVIGEAYLRPSPAMDLVQLRCCTEWIGTRGLSLSFIVLADPGFWGPQMAYIDHRRAGEARVGGRPFTLFGHDWRAVPVAEWLRLMARRELAEDLDPAALAVEPQTQRVVLSAEEFAAAVREALRGWGRRGGLVPSPLCRSRLVADMDGPPAEALADLLVTAVDALTEDPRDRRLHRAVAATYFRGACTQEAAAHRLGLPFSTYRRHLAAGIERVVAWLWDRELHGPG